jgi:hypothetical protein
MVKMAVVVAWAVAARKCGGICRDEDKGDDRVKVGCIYCYYLNYYLF